MKNIVPTQQVIDYISGKNKKYRKKIFSNLISKKYNLLFNNFYIYCISFMTKTKLNKIQQCHPLSEIIHSIKYLYQYTVPVYNN